MPCVPFKSKPKNLNFFTMRFPLPAIASILHRLSGLVLFLLLPFLLWLLQYSLTDEGFQTIRHTVHSRSIKCLIWLILFAFLYHLLAGVRHLLADGHIGTSRLGGKMSALMLFVVVGVSMLFIGLWLW